jgi:hypothetical protein
MNELLAAPASGLPFLSIAFAAHADDLSGADAEASHFCMNEVLAAPASGFPFLSIAFASQLAPGAPAVGEGVVCACAMLAQKRVPVNARTAYSSQSPCRWRHAFQLTCRLVVTLTTRHKFSVGLRRITIASFGQTIPTACLVSSACGR